MTDYAGQTEWFYGRSATVICDTGYVMSDGSSAVVVNCTSRGNWSERVQCQRKENIEFNRVFFFILQEFCKNLNL